MKTQFKSIAKDNIVTGALLAAMFLAIVGNCIDAVDASADEMTAAQVQKMDTILVTASRDDVVKFEAMIVTASRDR